MTGHEEGIEQEEAAWPSHRVSAVTARIETSLRRQADKIDIHRVNNETARSITFRERVGIDLSRGM